MKDCKSCFCLEGPDYQNECDLQIIDCIATDYQPNHAFQSMHNVIVIQTTQLRKQCDRRDHVEVVAGWGRSCLEG